MWKRVLTGCALVLAFGMIIPELAQAQGAPAEETIQGTVVDITCKFAKGVSGDAHRACGEVCAKAGLPLAILATDGTLYVPLGVDAGKPSTVDLKPHVDHQVTVKGKVFTSGNAKGIMISEVSMGGK
jgi:hypothetical protein